MSKAKPKFYVVWVGAKPGVYTTWSEASAQVAGFSGAKYKSFTSHSQAEAAFAKTPSSSTPSPRKASFSGSGSGNRATPTRGTNPNAAAIIKPSLSVDAACSGNPGLMEYQGVSTATKERIFHKAFPLGTNNIGEFLGLVHGLAWCQANDLPEMTIYTDSRIAMGWVAKKKCKTTLKHGPKTAELLDMVTRGEEWLKAHTYRNPIRKWETKLWGEIPADFGRK